MAHGIPGRRHILQSAGLLAGALWTRRARAHELPPVTNPKAIAGDAAEPQWQERLTVTVGPEKADLVGSTGRVIQAAVDYVARLGGGTVRVLPGKYVLRNSVFLPSNVRLVGSGADSVLIKEASATSKLSMDGDHWDREITLADAKGFEVGDGVRIVAKAPYGGGNSIVQRTLVARSGNRFKLDSRLVENIWLSGDPHVATNHALLQVTDAANIAVENITLDGNKSNNQLVDAGRFDDGTIRIDSSNRITMRQVTVRNFYCDGIVWGVAHDVVVEDCHVHDGARMGLHSGSGSRRSIVRGNRLVRNDQGLYFCWGAKYGLYEKNVIEDNASYGISIGHSDTDNLIRDNDIRRSGKIGVVWRNCEARAFAPHRNQLERNRIVDSGAKGGVAIDVTGESEAVALVRNELVETRGPLDRIGIRIGAEVRELRNIGNQIKGFAVATLDLRKGHL